MQEVVRCVRTVRLNSMPRARVLTGGLVVSVSALRLYHTGGGLALAGVYHINRHHPRGLQLGLRGFYAASLPEPSYLTVERHRAGRLRY